jgi:hypothetical protein
VLQYRGGPTPVSLGPLGLPHEPMSTQTHFFATAADLLPVAGVAEASASVQYVVTGLFEASDYIAHHSAALVPGFGIANADDMNLLPQYLVAPRSASIHVRTVPQQRGGTRYAIDQLANPESIIFAPGGVHRDLAVISGRVGSVHSDPVSAMLMKAFARGIKKFRRVRSYYVGQEAESLWKAGYRLTSSVRSPPEYDLIP